MFDEPGIDVDEIAWIERDQFVYFMEMEHQLGDPGDWGRFRLGLADALGAAFGWGSRACDRAALALLDEVRETIEPEAEWDRFLETVWSALPRHQLLPSRAP